MGFLEGKKILITGVVSNRSIAYGIAKACKREGAELAFSYANERFKDRIVEFAKDFGSDIVLQMDVSSDEQIEQTFAALKETWGYLDGVVHSIGFAPREAITGDFLEGCTREAFQTAMDISAYSFPAIARAALPLMEGRQGSFVTLTYLGGERVVPNYNTMGVVKAALESSTRYIASSIGPKGHRCNSIS
ncbi:MAG: SDR family oxidoreductase, partial [Burkholderiaceae bacterium]|nr:SDR family oxidoreductase [Burkholderiaceae bacterium]